MNEPKHIETLRSNLSEIQRLVDIHGQISGVGPGYKHNVQILNKSAIIMLISMWESYIEDLAEMAFDYLLNSAKLPEVIPSKVLTLASNKLKKDKNDKAVWKLAGDGWKNVLKTHREYVLDKYIGKLNTPRPKQIDSIYYELLGMQSLSSLWYWRSMSNTQAISALENLITLRGSIAHKLSTSKSVTKAHVHKSVTLVLRMAIISSNRVNKHLEKITGENPWDDFKYAQTH